MQLQALVNQNYDKLNDNDKHIIQQILSSQQTLRGFSCEQMAEACHVSRATLLRMCRKIGLSSFSDLKYLLKEESIHEVESNEDFHQVCTHYKRLIEEIQKISFQSICERIEQADTIYIYGTGNEQKNLAEEFKRIFLSVHVCVIDVFDKGEIQLLQATFQPQDLFIIISLSGETKEGIEILKDIKPYIHTCSLTRFNNNTIATLCEENLYVATQRLAMLHMASYEVVGAFYVLLDLLFMNFVEYRRRML